jgi:type III restriction enzyme
MFELKRYQKDTLGALETFLRNARTGPVADSFAGVTGRPASTYRHYSFGEIPYVCLRLPTGGGKTVLASHAVRLAAENYLEESYPIVLWLVPTKMIRQQTLDALKTPGHPYRAELDRYFDHQVRVLDVDEVTQIRPHDLGSKAIVVVSTLANLRVTDTSGRKVYAYHEDFEAHFAKVNPTDTRLERVKGEDLKENGLGRESLGKIKYSFANLLAMHNPLVIIDEAHNARTKLTFETLHRIHPACVVELSATPDVSAESASNVLYHVSAAELKAEQMIKLPIMLTEHSNWQESVRDAVLTRNKLAQEAQKEPDYIRPIVLFQAEAKNGAVTVDVLKNHLIEDLKINEEQIAIATGNQRDLDGVDLFDPGCKIEYIITIEALKEGWDCSFAYIFCSVKEVRSSRDAEQLLGRVLRMPYAKRRKVEALNRAYAHLATPSFSRAAQELTDKLINMGFEAMEIPSHLQRGFDDNGMQGNLFGDMGGVVRKEPPLEFTLDDAPDLSTLTPEQTANVIIVADPAGGCRVELKGAIDEDVAKKLVSTTKGSAKKDITQLIQQHNARTEAAKSPAQCGELFKPLPRLCLFEDGRLRLLEQATYRYLRGEWSLLDFPVKLDRFTVRDDQTTFEVDMAGKKVSYRLAEKTETYNYNLIETNVTETDLVGWLSRKVRQPDVGHGDLIGYLTRLVSHLLNERGFTLTALLRAKFPLVRAICAEIDDIRKQVEDMGFQAFLFDSSVEVQTSIENSYHFDPNLYPARGPYYQGRYKFQKHYFPVIPDLLESNKTDTEFECAKAIDSHPKVKHWVRNLVRQQSASFSLPLAQNNFYPDFIVELEDGRLLVVEYKGEGYKTTDDSREKKVIGELWAEKSGGACLFLFAVEKDVAGRDVYQQLERVVG